MAPDRETLPRDVEAWRVAFRQFTELAVRAQAFAVLRAASDAGILAAARVPTSPAAIAAATGLDAGRVADICLALDAHGILVREGGAYRLAPAYAALLSDQAIQPLPNFIARTAVLTRALERAAHPAGAYTALDAEDALVLARAADGSAAVGVLAERLPEARAAWEAGGRHAEFGCGVGGELLRLLALFPQLTAVGVELEPAVLAQARHTAAAAGVADRVELRAGDARDVPEAATFDTIQWSQFFFPADSRPATLATIRHALKPGGVLFMPLQPPSMPASPEELHELRGQLYATTRLAFGGWGIPWRGADDLRAEVEDAGFVFVRVVAGLAVDWLVARRPE